MNSTVHLEEKKLSTTQKKQKPNYVVYKKKAL